MSPAAPIVAALLACGPGPAIEGKVVDIWGEPIEGATVRLAGHHEQPLTDREGRYRLPLFTGTREIKVGRQGYVQDRVEVVGQGRAAPGPLFELYPQPASYGLYLVNAGAYAALPPTRVTEFASGFDTLRGLPTSGQAVLDGHQLRVLFHTPLKADEVARLDLELHRLRFVDHTDMLGPLGHVSANVHLWVSDATLPIEVTPLRSRTDYLVCAPGPLEPGTYALQTQNLLHGTPDAAVRVLPDELRVVFPFEVR